MTRRRRRTALVAQHRMPEHDRERGSLRVLEVIEHLLATGWDVTFLSLHPSPEPRYERELATMGVRTIVGVGPQSTDAVRAMRPELAVVAFWHVAEQLLPFLRDAAPDAKVVVDTIDLHFVRNLRRRADVVDDAGWVDDATAGELRRELDVYAAADAVLTVSATEAAVLTTLAGDRLLVRAVPLAERTPRSDVPVAERAGIVFVGNFRHLPNIEAVAHLCQEVLPRLDPGLLAAHPVSIVGNELDDRVRDAARHPGVRLVGWVPDIGPYLAQARLAVAPLLHGAGVKGKVLQSLLTGTPMVVTPVALDGTSLRAPDHVLVGETPARFAAAMTELLADDDAWLRLADRGHAAVAAQHSVPAARAVFEAAITDVLAAPPRDGSPGSRRWRRHYAAVRSDVAALVDEHLAPGASILVISGGDEELVATRPVEHFPADERGIHSFHPVDGAAAVAMLEACRARGASHLVVPSTSYWWLHSYPELFHHLRDRWQLVAERDEARLYAAHPVDRDDADVLVVAASARSSAHRLHVVGDLPSGDLDRYERIVMAPGRRLEGPWLDRFLDRQHRLRLDVAQAAAAIGTMSVPPAAVRRPGVRARRTRGITSALPVIVGRRAVGLLRRAVQVLRPGELRFGVVDECPASPGLDAASTVWTDADDDVTTWSTIDVATNDVGWQGVPAAAGAPRLSVVIATYERAELLEQCLAGFVDQTLPADEWEVVVVDDGSGDATPEVLRRWAGALPLRWVRIDHAGRAAAKDAGILAAAGEVVLLFDDDDVPDPDLLLEHVKAHADDPDPTVAVLGYTDFAAGIEVTPLMRFVTEGATMMFAYHELADGDRVDWRYFWEGRLSIKRALLVEHGLHDPRLEYSIDVELGYRLATGPGLTVVHRRSAVSHMARSFTYDEFLARMEAKGRAQHRFASLHPDPAVRAYCHIDVAERDWQAAAPTFDADRSRIAELEAIVSDEPELISELHELYVRTLRGANRRGVLAAAAVDRSATPVLSVVVPVWSVTPELAEMAARTLERVREVAAVPTEIVVVDNGSPHRVELGADVLIEHAENEGVAPAWNAGVRAATAPIVAVLNSDVHVEPGWDTALVAAAGDGRRIAFPHTDHGDGLGPRRADQAGTAGWCFALRRDLYDELGPFDEAFRPAFFEDADYWTRAHGAGVELSPVPAAVVRHTRRTSARHQPSMEALFQAHRMKFAWKHGIEPTAPPPYWHRTIVEHP